jgi:hypothetical protein
VAHPHPNRFCVFVLNLISLVPKWRHIKKAMLINASKCDMRVTIQENIENPLSTCFSATRPEDF